MNTILHYIATFLLLLGIDYIWLSSMASFYRNQIGHLMKEKVILTPVILFYILYTIGIHFFILSPSLTNNYSLIKTFLSGALLGLVAYGAYDFTNHATLKNWTVTMSVTDMLWGAVLTGLVSVLSVYIYRLF